MSATANLAPMAPGTDEATVTPLVRLANVQKSFGAVKVLDGVSFEVERGEVAVIIGQSGSGKSTALRCIDALEKFEQGTIHVCGHAVHDKDLDRRALRRDVGIVFQSYNLFPHLTVEQNIMLAPTCVKSMRKAEARELARTALARVGLADKATQYPEQLSGGQQQRVAIARSLAMMPKVMLFDEVTSALDPQLTAEVLKVMEGLARDGMTMILVTHEMGFARKVASKIIYMYRGKVWESGPASMLDQPQTKELSMFVGTGLK
ncbi:amino acid ABC transporter ATP-binding protein [Telmatospirillum sp.]|uniref:amino acid ABC transporter ATP-binding protein n=1 Tax=Telmatospirillum sp. TaxID=2079197 RepID=UPI00283E7CA4|nr:amino acid ABC transporter ATP-binding protein [Telmatospirillum sp.]MDR3438836.1 amino acid ABC transporter ATP-binding protein [Telmatospirillum sp.]